jgi:hypothetical protein
MTGDRDIESSRAIGGAIAHRGDAEARRKTNAYRGFTRMVADQTIYIAGCQSNHCKASRACFAIISIRKMLTAGFAMSLCGKSKCIQALQGFRFQGNKKVPARQCCHGIGRTWSLASCAINQTLTSSVATYGACLLLSAFPQLALTACAEPAQARQSVGQVVSPFGLGYG